MSFFSPFHQIAVSHGIVMLIGTTTFIFVMSLYLFRRASGFRPSFRPMGGRFRGIGLAQRMASDWPVERVRSEFVDYFVSQQGACQL